MSKGVKYDNYPLCLSINVSEKRTSKIVENLKKINFHRNTRHRIDFITQKIFLKVLYRYFNTNQVIVGPDQVFRQRKFRDWINNDFEIIKNLALY